MRKNTMGHFGPFEILVLALLGLVIFGNRLPEVARGLGRALNEFRRAMRTEEDPIERRAAGLTSAPPAAIEPPKGLPPAAPYAEAAPKDEPAASAPPAPPPETTPPPQTSRTT